MNSSSEGLNRIDQVVFGCLSTSADVLLQRRALFVPLKNTSRSNNVTEYASNSDFCNQTLQSWKTDLSVPLVIDISFLLSPAKKVLIERWKFSYQRRDDVKEGRLSSIKKRIVTFLRSLYCFIRLLPGYQVLKFLSRTPHLLFELNDQELPPITKQQFESDTWKFYEFPPVFVGKGHLIVQSCYLDSLALQVRIFAFHYF